MFFTSGKYNLAWVISWIVLVIIGCLMMIETKGVKRRMDINTYKLFRTVVLSGAITFVIVAFTYNELEGKPASVNIDKLEVQKSYYDVVDGKPGVAIVSGKGCPEGHTQPSVDVCKQIETTFGGPIENEDIASGCIKNNNKVVFNTISTTKGTAICTTQNPCVCIENGASCHKGVCKPAPPPLPTWMIVTIALVVVFLLYRFRKQIVLGFHLTKYQLTKK